MPWEGRGYAVVSRDTCDVRCISLRSLARARARKRGRKREGTGVDEGTPRARARVGPHSNAAKFGL
jgi:hypothetical protein